MTFPERLAADVALCEARLMAALEGRADQPVTEAMRYAVRGGKRLRGFLVLEGTRMLGVAEERAVSAAAAVEALHAYSLVHDDLPCMDDDDLRRGQPTVHRKWDEATAVLAGDALQTLAFELLTDPALGSAEIRLALVDGLARASGIDGMVLGQALDIAAETAGRAALSAEPDWSRETRIVCRRDREFMTAALGELGLRMMPGDANFLLLRAAVPLLPLLQKPGILVRNCANFTGLDETWLRVGLKTRKENETLLRAAKEALYG